MVLVPAGGGTVPERAGRLVRNARMDLTAALHQLHFLHRGSLLLAPLMLLFAAWMRYRQSRAGACRRSWMRILCHPCGSSPAAGRADRGCSLPPFGL